MSGSIRVTGNASQYCAATGHGGTVIIEGDTAARCGISMKGVDIVVGGSVGHMSGFMAQSGRMAAGGQHVAFRSLSDNLVLGDTNGDWDVFVRSLGPCPEPVTFCETKRNSLGCVPSIGWQLRVIGIGDWTRVRIAGH